MIRAGDACTTQTESRRLCLSMLFGARNNQVHCESKRIEQVPELIQLESRREWLSVLFGPRRNTL